jgi:hypothetical protein
LGVDRRYVQSKNSGGHPDLMERNSSLNSQRRVFIRVTIWIDAALAF